mgnify:CR=1 FL=1
MASNTADCVDTADSNGLSLNDFRLWSTNSLKTFLRLRKKRNNGSFEELVAR